MDTSIIVALILGAASMFSSLCFGLIPNIRRRKFENLEKKLITFAKDLQSFREIENILLEKLSPNGKKETLRKEIRKEVEEKTKYHISRISEPNNLKKIIQ